MGSAGTGVAKREISEQSDVPKLLLVEDGKYEGFSMQ